MKSGPITKFNSFQSDGVVNTLDLDVRTRWNFALAMLQKFIKLKTSESMFLQYIKSSHERKEFNNKKLPYISEECWARIEGLYVIIGKIKIN